MAKLTNNQIVVKKELDFIVKQELQDGPMFVCENIDIQRPVDPNSSTSLRVVRRELEKMKAKFEEAKLELESVNKKHERELSEWQRNCRTLSRDKQSLEARIKQLQAGICQSAKKSKEMELGRKTHKSVLFERNCDTSSDETEYEVEQILAHETKRGVKRFLIRWKGFDSSHDSWASKNKLNCPKLLQDYLSQV